MLYLWGNCWSLSLCSPNLFYILLWPLVLSRPLRQLLLKKEEKKGKRRQVHIDQDLHVHCQDCDLFLLCFLLWVELLFSQLSKALRNPMQIFSWPLYFTLVHRVTPSFHVVYLRMYCVIRKWKLMGSKG